MEEVGRLVWFVPLCYVGLSWALMLALALLQGRADELLSDHRGAILLRTGVHLAVGWGYVSLVTLAARLLHDGGGLADTKAGPTPNDGGEQ